MHTVSLIRCAFHMSMTKYLYIDAHLKSYNNIVDSLESNNKTYRGIHQAEKGVAVLIDVIHKISTSGKSSPSLNKTRKIARVVPKTREQRRKRDLDMTSSC